MAVAFNVFASVLLLFGTIRLLSLRQKRWTLALWFPLLITSGVLLYQLLEPLPLRFMFSSQPRHADDGFVFMGIGFYLMFAGPAAILTGICLIVALVAYPKGNAWQRQGVWAGLSAAAATLMVAWLCLGNPKIAVQVVDADRQPMRGVRVKFTTFPLLGGSDKTLGYKITDKNGKVSARLPLKSWAASVCLPDSSSPSREPRYDRIFLGRQAGIEMRRDNDNQRLFTLTQWWEQTEWNDFRPRYITAGNFEKMRNFQIIVRATDEVISADIQQALHQQLTAVLQNADKYQQVLGRENQCGFFEIFAEIPLLAQIAQTHPAFQNDISRITGDAAKILNECWQTVHMEELQSSDKRRMEYRVICHWLGFDSSDQAKQKILPQIKERLQQFADELLAIDKLCWRNGSFNVYRHLGSLAKNATPEFLEVMASVAREREINRNMMFSDALKDAHPDVEQVRVYFDNPNPLIALSAIHAVRRKLQGKDAVAALKKICELADYLDFRSEKRVSISDTMDSMVYNILNSAIKSFSAEEAATALACVKKMPCAGETSLQPLIQALARQAEQE